VRNKISTARRYFQQWKQLGPNFKRTYAYTKSLFEQSTPDRERNLELFAKTYGMQKEELETILSRPHGLRRLITGKLYLPGQANADHKLNVVMEVALFISDYLTKSGGKFADVRYALERWMKESQKFREVEDADIEEENQEMVFIRRVLEAAVQVEIEGRPKREKLTEEEKKAAIRYGLEATVESTIREFETQYWIRIGDLMAEGLTLEQAREKIHQDLLDKGDVEGAEMMRSYQDIFHPLKTNDQDPPPSPSQPLSPG